MGTRRAALEPMMSTQLSAQESERRDPVNAHPPTGGGRRIEDLGGRIAAEACDGCGSRSLQLICDQGGVDQYRCRRCRYRVFSAQAPG
jgi:hypothetical protein